MLCKDLAMSVEQVENLAMIVCVGGLICFMFFIIYDLAKKSNAGKFGMFVLFFALGFGMLGFIIKTLLVEWLDF
jgi:hypothetical protein